MYSKLENTFAVLIEQKVATAFYMSTSDKKLLNQKKYNCVPSPSLYL
jgi:hypothetical protein